MDKRVEIYGTSRADVMRVNRRHLHGVATDFHWYEDEGEWRYTVELDSGEEFKLKKCNVREITERRTGRRGPGVYDTWGAEVEFL